MDKSRKQFSQIYLGWADLSDVSVDLMLVSGKASADKAAALPQSIQYSKQRPEYTMEVTALEFVYTPPGVPSDAPIVDANAQDMELLRQYYLEHKTFRLNPAFQWTGDSTARITNGERWYLPEEVRLSDKRQRFSMVVYSTETDFLHQKVLLLPGAVTMEQARFRPEIKEFAAQHPDDPTVFSCSILLFRAPGVAADAPVVDATRESIRTIRLFHPEAPGNMESSIFQRIEGEADILIDGDNPYYQDPEEETEAER